MRRKPLPIQTAKEARSLVVSVQILMVAGKLDQSAMDRLAPYARQAISARGLPPWERDYMEALADLLEAKGQEQIDSAVEKFEEALRDVPSG